MKARIGSASRMAADSGWAIAHDFGAISPDHEVQEGDHHEGQEEGGAVGEPGGRTPRLSDHRAERST